jgi:bifunctional non-homologous end joining protein LigD
MGSKVWNNYLEEEFQKQMYEEPVPVPESIALFYRDDRSDKVYQAQLESRGSNWVVTFQYGARGKTMKPGVKTKIPVHYDLAKLTYDKLVRSKIAKGYTPDGSGIAFTGTVNPDETTDFRPQLLNDITFDEAIELFRTGKPMWMQVKHDGERRGLLSSDHKAVGANRKGRKTALRTEVEAAGIALARQREGFLDLDTEDMGDHLAVFDVLLEGNEDLKKHGFGTRAIRLKRIDELISRDRLGRYLKVDLPVLVSTERDIYQFVAKAKAALEEGVVFRTNAVYTPGRPNSGGPVLKLKFWESITCRVRSIHPTKASIGLELLSVKNKDTAGKWLMVGNCTLPEKYGPAEVGDLVEIKYLYATHGGRLFEPSFKGFRKDLMPSEANTSQLKYKK